MKKNDAAPTAIVICTTGSYGIKNPRPAARPKKNTPEMIRIVSAFETILLSSAPFSEIICVVVSVKPKSAKAPAIARKVKASVKWPYPSAPRERVMIAIVTTPNTVPMARPII